MVIILRLGHSPVNIYLFKVNINNTRKVRNRFKIKNKLPYFIPLPSVSNVDLEQANVRGK